MNDLSRFCCQNSACQNHGQRNTGNLSVCDHFGKDSRHVNTSFVERHNGTDRNRNARKVRKTYRFSKDWDVHDAVTCFTMFSYNFCWPVRTLAQPEAHGRLRPRTPAIAAGLTDHLWSLREWLTFPFIQRE